MPVKAYITGPSGGSIAEVHPDALGVNRLHVDTIIDITNQKPIPVTFSIPGGETLPKMLSLYYNTTVGAIVASQYKRAITYRLPVGFNGYLIRYQSFQAESANSRVISELNMGTLNIITNAFAGGLASNAHVWPQWCGDIEAELTQAIGAAANVVVTVGYTNELNISARVGTIDIPKSSVIGSRWNLVLQTGDLGVVSVQSMSVAPTSSSGALKLLSLLQLAYHEDAGTLSYETLYSPGAVSFPVGTILGIEHQGGTVSKARRFDAMIQLVAEVL